jgi:CheY-like chemotaxis protein
LRSPARVCHEAAILLPRLRRPDLRVFPLRLRASRRRRFCCSSRCRPALRNLPRISLRGHPQVSEQRSFGTDLPQPRMIRGQEMGTSLRVPIVALTAHAMKGDQELCLTSGMGDDLTSPISPQTLGELLTKFRPCGRPPWRLALNPHHQFGHTFARVLLTPLPLRPKMAKQGKFGKFPAKQACHQNPTPSNKPSLALCATISPVFSAPALNFSRLLMT